jgi:hypothetical protein
MEFYCALENVMWRMQSYSVLQQGTSYKPINNPCMSYLFIYYAFSESIQGWLNLKDIEFVIEIYMS